MSDKTISFISFEAMMAKLERKGKRIWAFAMVLLALLVSTNLAWFIFCHR